MPYGLINQVNLTVVDLDVDVLSPQAVSIHCDHPGTNTVAALVLSPAEASFPGGRAAGMLSARSRYFTRRCAQLYVPQAGVIEGAHYVFIRPAQGELDELILNVPPGATVTDVTDPQQAGQRARPGLPLAI